jgi:predicted nucleic acid-binding protein
MALSDGEAVAPPIWTLEAANALAVAEHRGRLNRAAADQFICLLDMLPITVDTSTAGDISVRILAYAREHGLSVYDASYLELAIREGLPLATLDKALLEAMRQTGVATFWNSHGASETVHETSAKYSVSPIPR